MGGFAWVTLATNDSYSLGALVLAHSLRRVGTQHDLAILITPGVSSSMREKLESVFTLVREVNVLDSKDEANLGVLQRPELGITFTKLHCWRLTQYEKCVFIDADTLVVRNCDELFEREELSAAPDVGWPDCFNSGVFVFKPSQQTFASITAFAASQGSFDGADQGLLNQYFSDWAHKDISKHLPFIYNMCSAATYSYAPAFKQYGENVRIVHFIGNTKPWLQYFDTLTGIVQPPPGCNHLQPLLQIWWNIFCDSVHPQLTNVMVASTLTTVWHNPEPLFPSSYPFSSSSIVLNSDNDSYIEQSSPDFSEFKDPWDHYAEQKDSESTQQTDKQYYCDTNVDHRPSGSEPRLTTSNLQSHELQQDSTALLSHENFQASQQDCFSFQSEVNQEFMEYHCAAQKSAQQTSSEADQFEMKQLTEYLAQASALGDFIDQFTSDDCNHPNHQTNSEHSTIDVRQNSSNETQTDSHIPNSSHIPTAPCTVPNNVATQSEQSASPCIQAENSGLAGALSELTLGESRTEEQRAIEEHMRKANWESGNIDYMGRDSFDNILKKINQTLAKPPSKESSPTKETEQPKKSSSKSSEVEAAVGGSEVALPVLATEIQTEAEPGMAQGSSKETCQRISSSGERLFSTDNEQGQTDSSSNNIVSDTNIKDHKKTAQDVVDTEKQSVPIVQLENVPEVIEQSQQIETAVLETPKREIFVDDKPTETAAPEPKEAQASQETISSVETDIVQRTVTVEAPLDSEKFEPVPSQVISEATSECPVPIQVAESVLQAEPKETVSEDPRPVIEAVASSIIPPVQESALTSPETPIESGETLPLNVHQQQLNGHDPLLEFEKSSTPLSISTALVSRSPNIVSIVHEFPLMDQQDVQQVPPETQQVQTQPQIGHDSIIPNPEEELSSSALLEESQTDSQKSKLTIVLPPIGAHEDNIETNAFPAGEPPVRPIRSKDLKIPSTPIVIGPTPPTSPPLDPETIGTNKEEIQKDIQAGTESQAQPSEIQESRADTETQAQQSETQVETQGSQAETEIQAQPLETPIGASEELQQGTETEAKAVQPTESQKTIKKVRKIVKKSSAESDSPSSQESEGSGKKLVKKVVKKEKKPKEGEEVEGSSRTDKPKKMKTIKKAMKTQSSTSLEADDTVPETPPPSASSEVPVPPKRKAKTSSKADKKSDES